MSVVETIVDAGPALGSFEVELAEETPDYVLAQLGYFGHVAIVDGRVDVEGTGDGLLAAARYVGVLRGKPHRAPGYSLEGSGMVFWLGDEDDKGHVLEAEVSLTNATLAASVAAVLPPTVTVGTIHPLADPSKRYTGKHRYQSPRKALSIICDAFGVEFRVNGNATVDVGRQDQLYTATPDSIVVRRAPGADMDVVALGGDFDTDEGAWDYTTRSLLLGQTTEQGTFATGSANAPSVPYLDQRGNPVKFTRMISESGETEGSVTARAQLQLNRFNRLTRSVKVTADDYETKGNFRVGDNCWVYDPDSGISNAANEVYFRGEVLHPDAVRVTGMTWRVTSAMTVAFRTQAGVWVDLTPFVTAESGGSQELTVGDLPKSLTRGGDSTIPDRVDANLGKGDTPNAPTALVLETDSLVDPVTGANTAIVRADWTAPTQNTDNTALTDLSHYLVQYRPAFRAPQWYSTASPDETIDIPAVVGLVYDVRVSAVDKSNNQSAWTAVESITAAPDATAPPAPADPTISNFIGQLRVHYAGTDNLGQPMPSDTNRIVVESGPSAAGPWTEQSYLTPFAEGVAYIPGSYGVTTYARLVPYDHAGNAGAPSAVVSGVPQWVNTPDLANLSVTDAKISTLSVGKLTAGTMSADVVVGGRIATALTGARREVNAVGFQAWDASNALTISLDGVDNLLTGRYRTALSGRRIEMGSTGALGEINFFAPDGKQAQIRAWTENAGIEAVQVGVLIPGKTNSLWNRINYNSDEWASYWAWRHEFHFASNLTSKGDGLFQIHQSKSSQEGAGTLVRRLFIDKSWTICGIDNDGTFRVEENNGGTLEPRFTILKTQTWFEWPETSSRIVFISPGARNDESGTLQLANGFNFVARFRYLSTSSGASSRLEIRDGGTGYVPVQAGTYTDLSTRESKTGIADFDGDPLALVRSARVRTWRRKGPAGRKERRDKDGLPTGFEEITGEDGPEQLGVIAEESPAEWLTRNEDGSIVGVQYAAQIATLIGAVQQLAGQVDNLRGGRP